MYFHVACIFTHNGIFLMAVVLRHLKPVTYEEFLQTYFAHATILCDKSIGSAHKEIKLAHLKRQLSL